MTINSRCSNGRHSYQKQNLCGRQFWRQKRVQTSSNVYLMIWPLSNNNSYNLFVWEYSSHKQILTVIIFFSLFILYDFNPALRRLVIFVFWATLFLVLFLRLFSIIPDTCYTTVNVLKSTKKVTLYRNCAWMNVTCCFLTCILQRNMR